jgi:predicted RNase H-like nuclease (RuvC/YqgF family)
MKEISDEKIFEYLMTSDFIENYKPTEWKFLLLKFRSFYKNLRGSKERELEIKEKEISDLRNKISSLEQNLIKEKTLSVELQNKIDLSKKERKLTLKERLSGKIKRFDEDETQ